MVIESSCSGGQCELLVKLVNGLKSGNNTLIKPALKRIENKGCKCNVAYNNYAKYLLDIDRVNEAEKYFLKALKIDPTHPHTLFGLALVYAEKGQTDLENLYLRRTTDSEPDFYEAYYNLAINLQDEGKLEDAEAEYRKVLDRNPKHILARQNLGLLLSRLERHEEGVKLLERGIRLNPDEKSKTLGHLIIVLKKGGNIAEAEKRIEELKELSPVLYEDIKDELSLTGKELRELQQELNDEKKIEMENRVEEPILTSEEDEAEKSIIPFIRNRSIIHNDTKLKPIEQIYSRVLCKYENLHARIVPAGECTSCKKMVRGDPVYEEIGHFKGVYKRLIRYWGTPLQEVPILSCCGESFEAKWLEEYQGPDLTYRIPIGSYLVPVINNSDKYPVTVTWAEARQLAKLKQKQLELFDQKEKEWVMALHDFTLEQWNSAVKGFSAHWREHGKVYLLESALEKDLLGNVITKKELLDLEKNMLRNAHEIYRISYMTPVLGYLKDALSCEAANGLRWNIKFHKGQAGKVILEQAIVTFPLIEELEWMRLEALNELGVSNNLQIKVFIDRTIALDKRLQEKQQAVDSLTKRIKEMQLREDQLEQKVDKLTNENNDLKNAPRSGDLYESQRRKIRQLKALIGEMQDFIKSLPQELVEQPVNFDEKGISIPEVDSIINVDKILSNKVVGIIGGFSDQVKIRKAYACEVVTATGKSLDDVIELVGKSDIVVVLTQHVSHAAMWLSKEYAIDYGKPIVFSKHENISILLTDAAAAVVN